MADCIDPGTVREEDLAAYVLDPVGDAALAQHIAQCPACTAKVAEMHALTTYLGTRLSRFDCPSSDELDAYLARELSAARQVAVVQHIQQCSRCQEEVTLAQTFLSQADPLIDWLAAAPPSRLRRLIAALQSPSGNVASPVLVLRGTAYQANTPQIYTVEDVSISLRHRAEPAAQSQLQGIISVATDPDIMMAALPVQLLTLPDDTATPTLFAETIAEMGFFEIAPVPPGRYHLEITLPERTIVIETLTF